MSLDPVGKSACATIGCMPENRWFWATLTLSSITIVSVVLAAWELVENRLFRDADYITLHYLYITRGVASSLLLAFWAAWFVLRQRRKSEADLRRSVDSTSPCSVTRIPPSPSPAGWARMAFAAGPPPRAMLPPRPWKRVSATPAPRHTRAIASWALNRAQFAVM